MDVCAEMIADLLGRQTRGLSCCTKKVMFQKRTGTAVLLKMTATPLQYMKETMSIYTLYNKG